MRYLRQLLVGTTALTISLAGAPAFAQNEAGQEASSDDGGGNVIVVTAQRREQSVQDVSATISAFGGEQLEKLRFDDVNDVANIVPNVDIKKAVAGNNSVITIRGVGLNDFSSNNTGSVAVYVDDVFLSTTASLEFSTFDTERLEVLKGPQGTLYGRNSTGGAVNIISRKPEFDFGGYATLTGGNFGVIQGEAAITGPLSDVVAFRLSGRVNHQGQSFFDNQLTGDDYGDRTAFGIRGQLGYESDAFKANLKVQYSDDEGPATPYKLFGAQTPQSSVDAAGVAAFLMFPPLAPILATDPSVGLGGVGAFCAPVVAGNVSPTACADLNGFQDINSDPRAGTSNFAGGNLSEIETFDATLTMSAEFGDATLTSVTGYRTLDRSFGEDIDASPATLFEYLQVTDVKQFSQELRLNVTKDDFDVVLGGFYSYDKVDHSFNNFSDDLFLTRLLIAYEQTNDAFAGFVDASYIVSDLITLRGGLRLTYEKKSYVGGTTDTNPFGTSLLLQDPVTGAFFPGPLAITATDVTFSETDLSGRAVVEVTPNDDVLLYASFSRGFKSGGVIGDITFANEELVPFRPEVVYAYELGLKTEPTGTLRFNASAFYYDYKDIQTFVAGTLGPVLGNADSAKVYGADVEVFWNPIDPFTLNLGLGLLDTELGAPFNGNKLPNAPSFTFTALASYDVPVSDNLDFNMQVGLKHSSSVERDAANTPVTSTGSYTILNARIGLATADSGWEFSIFGENLTGEDYSQQTFLLPTIGNVIQQYNAPFTFGGSVTKRF